MPTPRDEVLDFVQELFDLHVTSFPEIRIRCTVRATLEPLTSLRVTLHNQIVQTKHINSYVFRHLFRQEDAHMARRGQEFVITTLSGEKADGS